MKILELNGPLRNKRMIEYGVDGNKVVRHWREVRHAIGNIWISEPENDEWGRPHVDTFLVFPEGDGLMTNRYLSGLDWREVEDTFAEHYTTLDELYELWDKRVGEGRWIGNAQIEFVRQFDPARADRYAEARRLYIEKREAAERERLARIEAEEAAEREKKLAEEKVAREVYHGWADKMTALQFGRVDNTLSKMVLDNERLMTKREWVESKVAEGWKPDKKEGVTTWYGSKWNVKESKPKTEYRMIHEGEREYYIVNKTEYDYATFLAAKAA